MSDGPRRSLQMRPGWKQLAKCVDNRAYAPEEIRNVVIPALAQDWRADISDTLAGQVCEIVGDPQASLFRQEKIAQLEALRSTAAAHGVAELLIDLATQTVSEGRSGSDAAAETGAAALSGWAARGARQVEEHYHRESSVGRARNVRARIEEGIGGAPLEDLARQLLKLDPRSTLRASSRRTGLDDGVRL